MFMKMNVTVNDGDSSIENYDSYETVMIIRVARVVMTSTFRIIIVMMIYGAKGKIGENKKRRGGGSEEGREGGGEGWLLGRDNGGEGWWL